MDTPTTNQTISIQQLADLAELHRTQLVHCRGKLPPTVTIHTGKRGQPAKHFGLADLADLALLHTSDLTDSECRLIVAIRRLATNAAVEGEQP